MNWIATALACLAMTMVSCKTTSNTDPEIHPVFNHKTQILTVQVTLPDGKHAYAPGEKVGRPVSLEISPETGWKQVGATQLPKGNSKHLLSNRFEIKTQLTGSSGDISGILKMQMCSDKACERPRDYAFKISL